MGQFFPDTSTVTNVWQVWQLDPSFFAVFRPNKTCSVGQPERHTLCSSRESALGSTASNVVVLLEQATVLEVVLNSLAALEVFFLNS